MTKDEAISWLVGLIEHCGEDVPIYDEDVEALGMAINALEVTGIGYWLATENEDMEVIGYYCSRCDLPMETDEKTDYCPNCGARMVEPIGK